MLIVLLNRKQLRNVLINVLVHIRPLLYTAKHNPWSHLIIRIFITKYGYSPDEICIFFTNIKFKFQKKRAPTPVWHYVMET
jgi:hypothetical protein